MSQVLLGLEQATYRNPSLDSIAKTHGEHNLTSRSTGPSPDLPPVPARSLGMGVWGGREEQAEGHSTRKAPHRPTAHVPHGRRQGTACYRLGGVHHGQHEVAGLRGTGAHGLRPPLSE